MPFSNTSNKPAPPRPARWPEAILWCTGLVCFLLIGVRFVRSQTADREARSLAQSSAAGRRSNLPAPADPSAVVASLHIASLGVQVPVLATCTVETLRRGSCRVQGTAELGGLGTTGIAGHRDTVFRPLEKIHQGDQISLQTRTAAYVYRVDRTEIVSPDETGVLDIHEQPALVLITCYPFRFVGSAPKRFIVHASLQSMTTGS